MELEHLEERQTQTSAQVEVCNPTLSGSCHSPAPRRVLSRGLIDWHTGGGEESRAVLTVTETTSRVQHARLAQPARQTTDTTVNQFFKSYSVGLFFLEVKNPNMNT